MNITLEGGGGLDKDILAEMVVHALVRHVHSVDPKTIRGIGVVNLDSVKITDVPELGIGELTRLVNRETGAKREGGGVSKRTAKLDHDLSRCAGMDPGARLDIKIKDHFRSVFIA